MLCTAHCITHAMHALQPRAAHLVGEQGECWQARDLAASEGEVKVLVVYCVPRLRRQPPLHVHVLRQLWRYYL